MKLHVFSLLLLCAFAAPVAGQPATERPANAPADARISPPLPISVVLLGEKPARPGAKKKYYDLGAITTMSLSHKVRDLTQPNHTLDETMRDTQTALESPSDVAIIFAGAADEKAGTPEDTQQYSLKAIAGSLISAGARVYIVPSSPEIGTLTAGNLRLAASSANATFIETGSQITGQPYFDVMAAIRKAEQNPRAAAAPKPTAAPAPTEVAPTPVSVASTPAAGPASLSLPSTETTATKDEVSATPRAGVFVPPTPAKVEDLVNQPAASAKPATDEAPTTGPRRVTSRGADATPAIINMRPPPALKNFSPKKPVPRKDVDKKQPDLAR